METLPPELIVYILESLDQADLRSVSAVSRLFYDSAWSAGRYLHRSITWGDTGSRAAGHEIVPHARKKGLRLSLSIDLQGAGGRNAAATKVLALVDVALPVLVYLDVWVSETLLPSLAAILRHPVPDIGSLRLCVRIQKDSVPLYTLPVGLFAGSAPKLGRLELLDIAFPGDDPIPALALAHSASVSYTARFPYIDFGHHFPRLRNLDVRYVGGNTDAPPPPAAFKLDGVRLRRLFVQDYEPYAMMPTIMRLTDVAAIPSVVHTSDEISWSDPFWHRARDALSVRLARCVREDGDINVRVVPAHRRWRREYNMFWTLSDEFPILQLPALGERLVYLRLENRLITNLLTCDGLALGALRELLVDFRHPVYPQAQDPVMEMVWPPDWLSRRGGFTSFDEEVDRSGPVFGRRSYCTIGCTALRQLTLATCDEGISLASEEIAFLGRALGQCDRLAQDRAVLVLAGTSMKTPVAQALLDQTFSAVLADGDSLMERDAGFWDDLV